MYDSFMFISDKKKKKKHGSVIFSSIYFTCFLMLFPTYDFFFLNVNHLFFLVIFSMIHLSHVSLTLFLTHSSVDCLKEIIFINMGFVFFFVLFVCF